MSIWENINELSIEETILWLKIADEFDKVKSINNLDIKKIKNYKLEINKLYEKR